MPVPATTTTEPKVDDFGYDEPAAPAAPVVAEPAAPVKADPPAEEVKITGYEDKPAEPVVAEPAAPVKADPPAAPTDEEGKLKVAIADAVKALGDGYNKEGITQFAVENKMSAEQVSAYVKFQAAEDAKALTAHENRIKEQRKQWLTELKADKDFAGDKGDQFDKSVHKVNQLLEKMPNTKKMLTDNKGMLPPYFMKDFLALAKALNPTTKFEGGEPPAPADKPEDWMDNFYK